MNSSAYWLIAAVLIVFGFITGFSIGPPFLLFGLAMLVAAPVRRWPRIFWPILSVVPAFTLGFALSAPLTCTAVGTPGQANQVSCMSILGGPYVGTGIYNPPLDPAIRIGALAAVIAAVATYLVVRRRA